MVCIHCPVCLFVLCVPVEPVPVPGSTQLPGPFGSVWNRLHRGLGLYLQSVLELLYTHQCLISFLAWDLSQETQRTVF